VLTSLPSATGWWGPFSVTYFFSSGLQVVSLLLPSSSHLPAGGPGVQGNTTWDGMGRAHRLADCSSKQMLLQHPQLTLLPCCLCARATQTVAAADVHHPRSAAHVNSTLLCKCPYSLFSSCPQMPS